ncbi:MAG: hypothetical protein LBU66_04700 [Treponema sp.]|jgi:hypothetical protein|nr:hypothetical protein [Treponema sp.]
MKFYFKTLACLALLLVFLGCGKNGSRAENDAETSLGMTRKTEARHFNVADNRDYLQHSQQQHSSHSALQQSLDEYAELERAGAWFQGMGMAESALRENAGDFAGAVAAAYKELAWAYGRGLIQKPDIEQGLLNLLDLNRHDDSNSEESVIAAANAVLSFVRENWDEAASGLAPLFDEYEEPDGFGRWMMLVCALEKNPDDRRAGAAYKAIRARYSQFPEYWYRGARAFYGAIAAEYAESCVNLSPQGPFADECRKILASHTGIKAEDGLSIKTKREIEAIISMSVNSNNPQLLDPLMPLIGLPDNPYTVYAVGALRALSSAPGFRDYFTGQAEVSRGRLAERLSYICRG